MNVWRDRMQRWLGPVAARSPLSANALSILAMCTAICAGVIYAFAGSNPHLFLVGTLVVAMAGVLDAIDGIVARQRNETSSFGDFLDHFGDRVSDTAVLVGWLIGARVQAAIALLAVALILLVGYAGTQIEATFRSRSYEGTGRGEFVLGMIALPILSYVVVTQQWQFTISGLQFGDIGALLIVAIASITLVSRLKLALSLGRSSK